MMPLVSCPVSRCLGVCPPDLLIRLVWQKRIEDLKIVGGVLSPTPLHPHPSQVPPATQVGGANPQTSGHWTGHQGHHDTGRQSVIRADDRLQPAPLGRTANKRKTDGKEARGVERDARAIKKNWRHGAPAGESRRGKRGGTRAINGT